MLSVIRKLTQPLLFLLMLASGAARADFTKTISVVPGVPYQAVTTWYYGSCSESLGVGSYTTNVAPTHGALSFSTVSGPVPGCAAGSPSLPAAAAFYTWAAGADGATTDYFQLYFELNGAVAEVIDVNVNLAPSPGCVITSKTRVSVPGTTDGRTRIGVGENVVLTVAPSPATWSIGSGSGDLTPETNGAEAVFTAPYADDTTTVVASTATGASCSIQFSTVEPDGLQFYRLSKPGFHHTRNPLTHTDDIEMYSIVLITPADVSFHNVRIKELDGGLFDVALPIRQYPLVTPIPGTGAQLLACDFDEQPIRFFSSDSYWIYEAPDDAEQPFSLVRTSISADFPYFGQPLTFSKRQISVLYADGTEIDTPNAPASTTTFSESLPFTKVEYINRQECLADVLSQFAAAPGASASPDSIKEVPSRVFSR